MDEIMTIKFLQSFSAEKIVFYDEQENEYIINDVESLFIALGETEDIIEFQLMDALRFMEIGDFLKEFKNEFKIIMPLFSRFYKEELRELSTKTI